MASKLNRQNILLTILGILIIAFIAIVIHDLDKIEEKRVTYDDSLKACSYNVAILAGDKKLRIEAIKYYMAFIDADKVYGRGQGLAECLTIKDSLAEWEIAQ